MNPGTSNIQHPMKDEIKPLPMNWRTSNIQRQKGIKPLTPALSPAGSEGFRKEESGRFIAMRFNAPRFNASTGDVGISLVMMVWELVIQSNEAMMVSPPFTLSLSLTMILARRGR